VTGHVPLTVSLNLHTRSSTISFALGANAFEQHRSWLVLTAFPSSEFSLGRDEFATECLREDRLGQFFGTLGSGPETFFNGIGEFEESVDAADDFLLLR
jgi:hypothetical protein